MRIDLDWKFYSAAFGLVALAIMARFFGSLVLFVVITMVTISTAFLLRLFRPLKYLGIEMITLPTMIVGYVYGPVVGGVYGFALLIAHLAIAHYYIGTFVIWVVPEYVALGVLSGILKLSLFGAVGVSIIVGINLLNLLLTALADNERVGKLVPYVIGNSAINSLLFIQLFEKVVGLIA